MKRIFLLLLSAAFLLISGSLSAANELPHLDLQTGQIYQIVINSRVVLDQKPEGQNFRLISVFESGYGFQVKSKEQDTYQLEAQYTRLQMTLYSTQDTNTYTSLDNHRRDFVSILYRNLVNKPFKVTLSEQGRIEKIEGLKAIIAAALTQLKGLAEGPKKALGEEAMKLFGPEAFKRRVEMVTHVFPDKLNSTASSWQLQAHVGFKIPYESENTFQVQQTKEPYTHLKVSANLHRSPGKSAPIMNGITGKYDLQGQAVGMYNLEKSSGWLHNGAITQQVKGNLLVDPNEKMPKGMTIPISIFIENKFAGHVGK